MNHIPRLLLPLFPLAELTLRHFRPWECQSQEGLWLQCDAQPLFPLPTRRLVGNRRGSGRIREGDSKPGRPRPRMKDQPNCQLRSGTGPSTSHSTTNRRSGRKDQTRQLIQSAALADTSTWARALLGHPWGRARVVAPGDQKAGGWGKPAGSLAPLPLCRLKNHLIEWRLMGKGSAGVRGKRASGCSLSPLPTAGLDPSPPKRGGGCSEKGFDLDLAPRPRS